MLDAVTHPVCVRPNASLRAHAAQHEWPCVESEEVVSAVKGFL